MKILLALFLVFGLTAVAQQKMPDAKTPSGINFKDIPDMMRASAFSDLGDGDTLLEVNERRVQRVKELEEIFKDIKPGMEVKYKVEHNGKIENRKKKTK